MPRPKASLGPGSLRSWTRCQVEFLRIFVMTTQILAVCATSAQGGSADLECEGKFQMALVSQADMGPDLKDALAEVSTVKVHACLTYRSSEMFEDCLARKIALMGESFQEDINQIRQLGQGYTRGEQAFWRGELADDAGVDELRDAMKRVSKIDGPLLRKVCDSVLEAWTCLS